MTTTTDAPADPTRHPDSGRTVAEHLEHLDEQLRELAAADAADPSSTAIDPAGWQVRATERARQRHRLESDARFVREWRHLAWTHPRLLTNYAATARPVAARHSELLERWFISYRLGVDTRLTTDVRQWMDALTVVFRGLDQRDEFVRSVLVREFDRWYRLRNAAAVAMAGWSNDRSLPCPEMGLDGEGGLPAWLYLGAVRADLLRADPALEGDR